MKIIETKCPLCGSAENYTIVYKSNFNLSDLNPEAFSARRLPDYIHYQIVRCNNDGLVRSHPICDSLTIGALYKESKFNYAGQIDNLTVSYLKVLNEVLPRRSKEARILEIGCGNGFLLTALLDKGYSNLYGIEPSSDAVLHADKKIKDKILVDIFRDGLYKNETFDLIFFFQVFDHIYDPGAFLSACYNLLIPGGTILAVTHDIGSLSARVLKDKSPIIDIQHIHLYTKEAANKIFSKSGFMPLKVSSPKTTISLGYLLWLLPFPKKIKQKLTNPKGKILNFLLKMSLNIPLGNLCIIAKKPEHDR